MMCERCRMNQNEFRRLSRQEQCKFCKHHHDNPIFVIGWVQEHICTSVLYISGVSAQSSVPKCHKSMSLWYIIYSILLGFAKPAMLPRTRLWLLPGLNPVEHGGTHIALTSKNIALTIESINHVSLHASYKYPFVIIMCFFVIKFVSQILWLILFCLACQKVFAKAAQASPCESNGGYYSIYLLIFILSLFIYLFVCLFVYFFWRDISTTWMTMTPTEKWLLLNK